MSLEPVEVQHVKLGWRPLGYDRGAVERLLEKVTSSFEEVWLERDALRDEVKRLQGERDQGRERDRQVADVLASAQWIAEKRLAETGKRAETILEEARQEAEAILAEALREPERLRDEIGRLQTMEQAVRERYQAFLSGAKRLIDGGLQEADGSSSASTHPAPMADELARVVGELTAIAEPRRVRKLDLPANQEDPKDLRG